MDPPLGQVLVHNLGLNTGRGTQKKQSAHVIMKQLARVTTKGNLFWEAQAKLLPREAQVTFAQLMDQLDVIVPCWLKKSNLWTMRAGVCRHMVLAEVAAWFEGDPSRMADSGAFCRRRVVPPLPQCLHSSACAQSSEALCESPKRKRPKRIRPPLGLRTQADPDRHNHQPNLFPGRGPMVTEQLQGMPYGPCNTCPVDTLFTLMQFVFTEEEKNAFEEAATACARPEQREFWSWLLLVTGQFTQGTIQPEIVKQQWYAHLRTLAGGDRGGRFLRGHQFGLIDQMDLLLPRDKDATSPLHFCSTRAFKCNTPECTYTSSASNSTLHLPLTLTCSDMDCLLQAGVAREVGALVAAHLNPADLDVNPYEYEACHKCCHGQVRAFTGCATWTPLILVELGRLDSLEVCRVQATLPWELTVASHVKLHTADSVATYEVVAVVYNDGSHWWADLRCSNQGTLGSYRYDGLAKGGKLQFAGSELTLTDDPRKISLVLYRWCCTDG